MARYIELPNIISGYDEHMIRYSVAGVYNWIVPAGVKKVDVFLVGGGGGASNSGGGSGYTKAFRGSGYIAPAEGTWESLPDGGRDGDAIPVVSGESIQIVVGVGGAGVNVNAAANGGFSQFKDVNYMALGGNGANGYNGGSGGSGGSSDGGGNQPSLQDYPGSDGGDSVSNTPNIPIGLGQGHTTRDFGELTGKVNAGGGGGFRTSMLGGASDYTENSGAVGGGGGAAGGGGYGGGGGGRNSAIGGKGGDGTVLIRYYKI